ncbi:hypothetical protein [Novilysobacter defluvii]|nr:hypothetical protein [Lysobacter defluvii]
MRKTITLAPILVLALAACGDRDVETTGTAEATPADPALPTPAGSPGGSVTGMPQPGAGEAVVSLGAGNTPGATEEAGDGIGDPVPDRLAGGPADGFPMPGDAGPDGLPLPPGTAVADGGTVAIAADAPPAPPAPPPSDAPGSAASGAMAAVRSYYSAISAGDYAGAHRLWAGDGSASGQSLEQFANGFADTADVRVHMMEPQPAGGGAAGTQRITVPVTLDTTRRDGSSVQFTGSYTLSRPADGSGDWRIDSADLREVQR